MKSLLLCLARTARPARFAIVRVSILTVLSLLLLSACALPKVGGIGITATPEDPDLAETGELPDPTDSAPPAPLDAAPDHRAPSGVTELTAQDFTGPGAEPLHDLILFTSLAERPFAVIDLQGGGASETERGLWAVSPDGLRAGRISPTGQSSALYLPPSESGPVRLLTGGLFGQHEALEMIAPPTECAAGAGCSAYSFGAGGRTLVYDSGPSGCGRDLALYDLVTNQPLQTWSGVQWHYLMDDGSLVVSLDDCLGGPQKIYMYYPNNEKQVGLGIAGDMLWNLSGQAVLITNRGAPGVQTGLWGINLQTSRVFLWAGESGVVNDSPVWLPDGQHFVYQHRTVQYDAVSGNAVLQGPRQIILMNAFTRAQSLLAYDGRHDYHLCETQGESCISRYGDWLKIHRTPFRSTGVQAGELDRQPAVRCALFGLDCQEPPEEMALNWKTGEMIPWDEAGVVDVALPPDFPPPDLAGQPVYSDPAGDFALYTGAGGRTLWFVPAQGEPVLWVAEGENFVYLP